MTGLGVYHIDEGYSEHPISQDEQEMAISTGDSSQLTSMMALEEHALTLSEELRADYVYRLLQSLRTTTIADIVERLTPRLRLDPVSKLPAELISLIFSYLSPDMLMVASTVSKAWRAETLETSLWRRKFVNEGWHLNISKVLQFERDHGRASTRKPLSRRAVSDADSREHKRRAVSPPKLTAESTFRSDAATAGSIASLSQASLHDDVSSPMDITQSPTFERVNSVWSTMSDDAQDSRLRSHSRSLMIKTPNGDSRLDYHKLYSIRSQLEENWTQGKYVPFQFPHPDHPYEAHTECVYTVQFTDKHLVSGSRDKTIRIWDLETRRLVRDPLTGHEGSVLSLQFDESSDEDLIVSGSSDNSIGIWQFSTGKLIKRITDMHTEAVLCVRFDKNYLASCSKDHLIKIFNRRPMKPGDSYYPIRGVRGGGTFPDYIIDMSLYSNIDDFERFLKPEQKQALGPFQLIMTLEHHNRAVNSLHIHDGKLASGSGDRTAKVFNMRTGQIESNCRAHSKGVACIEYDGARLVSGSSDEKIRIFDPATNAEVGLLDGHSKLVRTIQADFADAPGAREMLEEDAMLADQAYLDAQNDEMTHNLSRADTTHHRGHGILPLSPPGPGRPGRATSPLHTVIGAKLPIGGGGNRWSRIVSGSYDETVLVWRRDSSGRWTIGQRYKVADVIRSAGPPIITATELQNRARRAARVQNPGQPTTADMTAPGPQTPLQGTANAAGAAATMAAVYHPGIGAMPQVVGQVPMAPPALGQHPSPLQIQPTLQGQLSNQMPTGQLPGVSMILGQRLQQHQPPPPPHQDDMDAIVGGNIAAAAAATAAFTAAAAAMHVGGSARAFKLQFDARRIICCSQDPKIVGWDFAAGNSEIIEAAKFFTRTSHYARGG